MENVIERIEKIRSVFLETQLFCAQHSEEEVGPYLEKLNTEFRSIGYESASMSIALKELQQSAEQLELSEWLSFANGLASKHAAQVHIGLGWAIAKLDIPFSRWAAKLDSRFHFRIVDGCGYYDGSFRKRQTVLILQPPNYLPPSALPIYYQGVGRSLWYSCAADIKKIRSTINGFPAIFQPDLWRGLGIAIAYVGGCDDTALINIMEHAGENGIQLACGAALAAGSRITAGAMNADTDSCSRKWFNMQTEEDLNIFSVDADNKHAYLDWILHIEKGLEKSFLLVA